MQLHGCHIQQSLSDCLRGGGSGGQILTIHAKNFVLQKIFVTPRNTEV